MWLLDANMDVHLLSLLGRLGVKCEATTRRGWQALNNGDLVSKAAEAGFTCLLTQDRLFGEAAARALKAHPRFSVIVVHLAQLPWKRYNQDFNSAWSKYPCGPLFLPFAGDHRTSRFSRGVFPCMLRFSDRAGPRSLSH